MISGLIDKILSIVRGSPKSLLRTLHNLIPTNLLEEQIQNLSDWRDLVSKISVKLNVSEDALWFRIAEDMGLSYVERVPPCNLLALPENLTVELLKQSAAIPLIKNGKVLNLICLDPKRARTLNISIPSDKYVLAPWQAISKAIDESEQIANQLARVEGHDSQANRGNSVAVRLLRKIIEDVISHGSTDVVFEFLADKISYSFLCGEGKERIGEVDSRVSPELLRLFTSKLSSFDISLPNGVRPTVEFLAGAVTKVRVSWSRLAREINSGSLAQSNKKIVIIDDSAVFAQVITKFLTSHSFTCETFTSARPAISWIADSADGVGAVICDMHMPEVDGLRVIKEIKGDIRFKHIPLIAITSSTESSLEVEALKLGVDAFITKDEDPEIILLHIKRLTKRLEVA
jgi:CheY-like chemotaxis protein